TRGGSRYALRATRPAALLRDAENVDHEHEGLPAEFVCRLVSAVGELGRNHHEHLAANLLAHERFSEALNDTLRVEGRGCPSTPTLVKDLARVPAHAHVVHDDVVTEIDDVTLALNEHRDLELGRRRPIRKGDRRTTV